MNDRITVGRRDPAIAKLLDEVLAQDFPGVAELATPEKIADLCEQHCKLYRFRLDGFRAGVNVEETERLLSIWQEARGKTFDELSEDAKLEVLDAIASENS